jgi:hypothetical protein
MERKEPSYPAQDPHRKAQDAIDHARDERERKLADRGNNKAPSLIADGDLQRCSVCGFPFGPDVKPFISVAFTEHLTRAHKPGQTSEDFRRAAFRAVKEATDKV